MAQDIAYQEPGQTAPDQPLPDKYNPAYRYAKALCESARSYASKKTKTFDTKWRFFQGLDQWRPPASIAAQKVDEWAFKGVVNMTYATVKTIAAQILNSQVGTFVDPLDDQSTYRDRQLWKAAIDHELERLHWRDVQEDMFLRGAVCYVGIAMVTAKPDPLTGAMALVLKAINPAEFYCDPSADSITDPACRFVVWEPQLDMSTVREMWPSKADRVKVESKTVSYEKTGLTYSTQGDSNLIYGAGGDFVVDSTGVLKARKARVQFVWIKDESLVEDLAAAQASDNQNAPIEPGGVPDTIVRRAYPYGRLIVYAGETLLYDGENPYEIEDVFPFSVFHYDRIPGDFYGTCAVDILASLQECQNTTVCQGIDYVRLAVNSPICYPAAYKAFTDLGNGPNQHLPGPDRLPWQPFRLAVTGFDVTTWNAVINVIREQFQVVSGLTSLGLGQTSSPPISATEAEIANARLSDRMKARADRFAVALSRLAEIVKQMMVQFYDQPMTVGVLMPDSEIQTTQIEVSSLPNVRIRVSISTEQTIKDKLLGQNLVQGIQSGVLDGPHAELFLESIGTPPNRIREIEEKKNLTAELVPPGMAQGPTLSLVDQGGP